jgi:hypothetical protein
MKLDSSSSTLRALLIDPGTVLFSLRSKLLRLQTEMPCARTDQFCEISGIAPYFMKLDEGFFAIFNMSEKYLWFFRDFKLSCFRDNIELSFYRNP